MTQPKRSEGNPTKRQRRDAGQPKPNNENERLALQFFTTLSSGDLEGVRALLHEEATWKTMVKDIPGAGTHVGRSGIVDKFLMPIRGMFKPGDPKMLIDTIASNGPLVISETRGYGTFANGREYANNYCWAFEMKDGKVFAIREYMDSLYVSRVTT
jgi:ketosteroid isomerase-like protein